MLDIPNLDEMDEGELMDIWIEFFNRPFQVARKLGIHGSGSIHAIKDIGLYASNKAIAQMHRRRGDIQTALMYERIADHIYDGLPTEFRW